MEQSQISLTKKLRVSANINHHKCGMFKSHNIFFQICLVGFLLYNFVFYLQTLPDYLKGALQKGGEKKSACVNFDVRLSTVSALLGGATGTRIFSLCSKKQKNDSTS